jgi:hypothetical protein
MITLYVNKKPHSIPVSWDETTFEQYLGVLNGEDKPDSYFLALMLGMDYEEFKKCELKGFEQAMTALTFLKTAPTWLERPAKIGSYILPADLTLESVGQYEDMKALVKGKKDIKELVQEYPKVCAIYCQKTRDGVYDFGKAMDMSAELMKLPAREVVETASFFLAKVILMTLGTPQNSPPQKSTQTGRSQTTSTKRSGSRHSSGRSTKNTLHTKGKKS